MKNFQFTPTGQRLVIAGALLGIWLGLVLAGMSPVQPFVDSIKDALIGLGIFHAALKDPKGN